MQFFVTPYYNGTYKVLDKHGNRSIRPQLLTGEPYSPFSDGYQAGVPLYPSMVGTMEIEAEDARHAAEKVFMALNRDNRPNGREEPSFSIGDVLLIRFDGVFPLSILTPATAGFREIEVLDFLTSVLLGQSLKIDDPAFGVDTSGRSLVQATVGLLGIKR